MKKCFCYFISFIIFFSCDRSTSKNPEGSGEKSLQVSLDTTLNNSVIILVSPNDTKINELKAKHGEEDFYIIADDANAYSYEATTILDSIKAAYFNTEKTLFHFPAEKCSINIDTITKCSWIIIEYEKGSKPKVFCPIDFINKYSKAKMTLLNINGSWSTECGSSNSIFIDVSGTQINFVEKYSLHCSLESQKDNEYNFKYVMPTTLIPAPEMDWDNFSKDSIIAKIIQLNEGKSKLYWFGLYNNRTQSREGLSTGFNNESSNKPIDLLKTDILCNN